MNDLGSPVDQDTENIKDGKRTTKKMMRTIAMVKTLTEKTEPWSPRDSKEDATDVERLGTKDGSVPTTTTRTDMGIKEIASDNTDANLLHVTAVERKDILHHFAQTEKPIRK